MLSRRIRRLEGVEVTCAALHDATDLVVSNLLRIEPALTLASLQSAARQLQQRFQILRCTLERDGPDVYFVESHEACVQTTESDQSFMAAFDAEKHTAFPPGSLGWRLIWCGAHVILTYHHSFLDGTALMLLVKELLLVIDGRQALEPHVVLPGAATGVASLEPTEATEPFQHRVPVPSELAGADVRRSRTLCASLPSDVLEGLLRQCRAHSATLTGALGAASARAFASTDVLQRRGAAVPLGEDILQHSWRLQLPG